MFSLILLNGVLAMSEVALLTSKRSKLTAMAQRGKKSAETALRISEDPTQFLSTIQIGITSIGLLSGIVGESIFAQPLSVWLQTFGLASEVTDVTATVIVVVLITYGEADDDTLYGDQAVCLCSKRYYQLPPSPTWHQAQSRKHSY
jgi:putative hemolysin